MKASKKRGEKRPKRVANFEEEYAAALQGYLENATEGQLRSAYELGRRGMTEGKTLVDVAAMHHKALGSKAVKANGAGLKNGTVHAAADFLAECLSPYEMARRGFHDAVKALRQMNETLEEEIKRIAYAVHDEAGQLLVTVHLALADLGRDLPQNKKEQIARIEESLNHAESELRRLSHELRPTILDDLGWIPAIRFLADGVAKRSNLVVQVKVEVSGRLPVTTETAVYRVVQEALNNVIKHGRASQVLIDINREGRQISCKIQDNGEGFDISSSTSSTKKPRGLGLIAMRERMNGIGGMFSIQTGPGRGTRVEIRFPGEDADANSNRSRG